MMRVQSDALGARPQQMSEDELIDWLEALAGRHYVPVLHDAVAVDAYDEDARICWRGYYRGPAQLHALLVQLRRERSLRSAIRQSA